MPSHLKFCGCRQCRAGLRCRGNGKLVQKIIRAMRRRAKLDLRRGKVPDSKASVPYTD